MVDECEACALRVADDCTICQTSSVEVQVAAVNQQRAAADKRIRDAIEALHLSRRQMKSLVYGPSFVAARVGTVPVYRYRCFTGTGTVPVNRHRYDYIVPVQKHRGVPGHTHGTSTQSHTGRAHSHRPRVPRPNRPTDTDTQAHNRSDPRRRTGKTRSRTTRCQSAATQKRPPPANPTLTPPAPRAPPRVCSILEGRGRGSARIKADCRIGKIHFSHTLGGGSSPVLPV